MIVTCMFTDLISRQGTLPDDTVNDLCDGVRAVLEKKDVKQYINSILTAHIMKRPSDHEAGLASLLFLRGMLIYYGNLHGA